MEEEVAEEDDTLVSGGLGGDGDEDDEDDDYAAAMVRDPQAELAPLSLYTDLVGWRQQGIGKRRVRLRIRLPDGNMRTAQCRPRCTAHAGPRCLDGQYERNSKLLTLMSGLTQGYKGGSASSSPARPGNMVAPWMHVSNSQPAS